MRFILLFIIPSPLYAWGPVGHKTVALIAQDRLSDGAKKQVAALLGEGVGLDEIALCPDDIRRSSTTCAGRFPMERDKKTSNWHFIDIPVKDSPTAESLQQYCDKDGSKDACVLDQIKEEADVLKDVKSLPEAKRRALIFLVHFVGDVHQPLHCSTEVNRAGRSDHGGNFKWLTRENPKPDDKKINLHGLWDSILRVSSDEHGPGPRALADKLEKDLAKKDAAAWIEGDFVTSAVLESHKIAKEQIYPQYHRDYGKPIGKAYQDKYRPVAYERIEMAGVRLAALLNASLK